MMYLCYAALAIPLGLIAHEAGHIAAAWFFHVRVKGLGISWLGPYTRRERTRGWREVLICLAGPAVNLALAMLAWNRWRMFAEWNLVLGVVNLLPISNSDGTHACEVQP